MQCLLARSRVRYFICDHNTPQERKWTSYDDAGEREAAYYYVDVEDAPDLPNVYDGPTALPSRLHPGNANPGSGAPPNDQYPGIGEPPNSHPNPDELPDYYDDPTEAPNMHPGPK